MDDAIYLVGKDGELQRMGEKLFETEERLQILLAKYPDLLAGGEMNPESPRRWLLIQREMGVPDEEGGSDRWYADHLFLDQEGIPTIVEVKRSTDTRSRREVVAQMLDYAANAVVYWPVEKIQAAFEGGSEDADAALAALLGDDNDPELFWRSVKTNLQAGRVRMVFVADKIPGELRRIVEFLNEQMDPAEVFAVEVRQFAGHDARALVPRLIGQTAEAQRRKGAASSRQWDEPSFFRKLEERFGPEEIRVARELFAWIRREFPRTGFGSGKTTGSFWGALDLGGHSFWPMYVWTSGGVEIQFQHMHQMPPFDNVEMRLELLRRLNRIEGISFPETEEQVRRRPSISFGQLAKRTELDKFLEAIAWFLSEARRHSE